MPITGMKCDEIYLDIIEKLTVLFNDNGNIINSSIDGCIQMKSLLKDIQEFKLIFNDNLEVGRVSLLFLYIFYSKKINQLLIPLY